MILGRRIAWTLALAGALAFSAPRSSHAQGQLPAADSAASGVLEGILSIVWGDPHPKLGSSGATRYTLILADGSRVGLRMRGKEGLAAQYFGKQVVVSGQALPNSLSPAEIVVDGLTPALATKAQAAAVVGSKKVIYLLLRFAGDPSVPHPPSFYSNLNNPDTPPPGEPSPATINGFFRKTSWNQFSWVGDVGGVGGVPATDWLTLPFPKSHYANCGWAEFCADLDAVANDGMTLGTAAGIDFTGYDNVNLVLSNDLDCCAYGGGLAYQGRFYGATWEPPWGQETGVYAHEMGHSLGLPHSGWAYWAYDSPWDVMSGDTSATSLPCGSYSSANGGGVVSSLYCSEPGGGYIAPHKDYLGWIPAGNEVVIDTSPGATTVTLDAGALPLGPAAKMVKICAAGWPCSGPNARYLTVEARVKGLGAASQFDNGLTGEGVIIHSFQGDRPAIGVGDPCYFNSQSGWAVPVDATPGDWTGAPACSSGARIWPDYALGNAQWLPGQSYADPASGRTIQVQSRTGSSFVIVVSGATQLHGFFTLSPCRVVDTRAGAAPLGGPALPPLGTRTFGVATSPCGIPAGASAISANITVVEPAAAGHLTLYPSNGAVPEASSINFPPGQTRANNLVLQLDPSGSIAVRNGAAGSVQLVLDVNGYFR